MKKAFLNLLKALLLPTGLYILFLLLNPKRFGNINSLYTVFTQSLIPTVMGSGLALGFISGMFDFTMGSRIILSGIIGGVCSLRFGITGLILGCVFSGILLGFITGVVNWLARIPSMVSTLGMAMVYEVLAIQIKNMGKYSLLSREHTTLGKPGWLICLTVLCSIVFYFIFYHTKFTYHVRAVGNDEILAKNAGIRVRKTKVLTFVVGGLFLGITSLLQISVSGNVTTQLNLDSGVLLFKPLIGVIIGLQLMPLCNIVIGIFIGSFSLMTIFVGLIAAGLPDTYQNVVLGLFLLIVMFVSQNQKIFKNLLKHKTAPAAAQRP
jgi:ribose transport system permease protein